MGVPGLWKELAPAAKVRSLTELAVVEGFEANPNGSRGFRIGIDASIWFFHAAYGKEGENPELRTMFFRCATLMHAPFLPLFVFDGPRRPNVKRGKKINRELHKLTPGMKQIVESFGFEWRVAPGEAEAELAYLNRIGVLDGILSDDVDNFLFGATTVIRNPSNNLSGNRANPVLNSEGRDDKNHTRVYRVQDIMEHPDVSLTRGDMILIGLCSGGDYDTSGMTGSAKNLPRDALPAFLHNWRNEIRHELRTDSKGYIGSKRRALASSLPDAFPDIDILLSYPDLGKLAATCEFYFEWGYRDAIIKRFKTVIWHGAEKRGRREIVPSTPTKNGKPGAEGTPSKLITKHFSSLTLNPVANDDDDRLITRITRTREHAYTDGILEYRLEIRPRQLVLLAESGIKNIRRPLDADVWAGLTESGNEGGERKPRNSRKRRDEREKRRRCWFGCRRRWYGWQSPALWRIVLEEDEESEPVPPKKAKAKPKPFPALDSDISSDDELPIFQLKAKAPAKRKQTTGVSSVPSAKTVDPFASMEPSARVVRDLTKGKGKAVADGSQADLKNFFPLSKAIARAKTNVQPLSAPLAPVPKLVVLAADSVRERTKHSTLSAPTPGRQTLNGSPSRAYLKYCEEKEESDDDVRRPATPSKIHGKKSGVENARAPSRMLPRPFPLSFEDRPPPRRRSSITSSDCDSESRSRHTSPREKSSAVRAPSPTPYRGPNSPSARNLPVIDISSDSDSPRPPVANTVSKAVLRPTNFLSREVIDISDL
ncbi:hypothetical protein B0H13DRAFT_1978057 [Mycena leptocephala]|nr:hypothetical protein B0H13DRAFT_1978057 [Mycena leptocephala]